MRPAKTLAVMAFFTVSLSGCSSFHRQPPPQAPALDTGQGAIAEEQKKEQQGPPAAPLPQPSAQIAPPQLPPVKSPKVKKKNRKKPSPATTTPAPVETAQAAANLPGANSPIGELTTGDSAAGQQTKHDTANLIAQTEQGLAGIKRPLSRDQRTTETEIHTFLKQAELALANGDNDGAHTLATKAKVLLDELIKQ